MAAFQWVTIFSNFASVIYVLKAKIRPAIEILLVNLINKMVIFAAVGYHFCAIIRQCINKKIWDIVVLQIAL